MPAAEPRPEPRILVADECRHARRQARDILASMGLRRVFEARDGAEAVGFLEAAGPTAIVVDWNLGVVGAPELMSLARSGKGAAPSILVTMVDARRGSVERAVEAGAAAVVVKPYAARILRARLRTVVADAR